MSSRKLDDGTVEITAPVYATMPVGHRLSVIGSNAEGAAYARWERTFNDYLARIALSSAGHANGVGITVRADETALLELIEGGLVHESLVEEPRAA